MLDFPTKSCYILKNFCFKKKYLKFSNPNSSFKITSYPEKKLKKNFFKVFYRFFSFIVEMQASDDIIWKVINHGHCSKRKKFVGMSV